MNIVIQKYLKLEREEFLVGKLRTEFSCLFYDEEREFIEESSVFLQYITNEFLI
ncbi:hypothetical protein SAMN05444416_101121 [Thermoactinomyces sp. DSM 45892]|nr:hypothetical protein SAMN05444416_101121 [Thermoactinomyces sp. DSM 45892]